MPKPRVPADFVEQVRGLYPTGSRCGFEAFVQLAWRISRPLLERVDAAERAAIAAEEERRQATAACESAWARIRTLEAK